MPIKITKLVALVLLLAQGIVAGPTQWPSQFTGQYTKPSRHKMYGCHGIYDVFTISLDFIANVYTKIDYICNQGDVLTVGERGQLHPVIDQAIKIQTETGYADSRFDDAIQWVAVEPVRQGYFTFDSKNQQVDEFDRDGGWVVRW